MAKTDFRTVDEYIAAQPEATQAVLVEVRNAILRALPHAEETISYKMPAYRVPGGIALYMAGWKRHYSLYPASERLVAAMKDQTASFQVSKGTIRFPLSEPVPARLITRIARFRANELEQRDRA